MTKRLFILSTPAARANAVRAVQLAPDGVTVTIAEPRRTLEQNDRMWAMLTRLSHAQPNGRKGTPDDWKHWIMHACGFECQFMEGLDGRHFPTGFKSSRLTVKQMAALMDWMEAYAAEHGINMGEV